MNYQRVLKKGTEPYDPLELTEKTREIVCRGSSRKYTDFYKVGVYGGITTGYTVGCNLRCYFCWVGPGRDHPEDHGKFYSAEEVVDRLENVCRKKRVTKARISGGEPTICKDHLLEVLEGIEDSNFIDFFILETNGLIIGYDDDYVSEISRFEKPYVRVSLKAGTPEAWEEKTGADRSYFELPYRAIEKLWKNGIDFHVAAMVDPRITEEIEVYSVIKNINEISEELAEHIEWETVDLYPNTKRRLKAAGKMDLF